MARKSLMCATALCLGMMSMVASANDVVYKWRDAAGSIHYSDTRPAGVKDVETIVMKKPTSGVEVNGNQVGDAASAGEPADDPSANPRCAAAQRNVDVLSVPNSPVMMDLNGDGVNETLTEDDKKKQLDLAKAQKLAYCGN